MEDFVLKIDLHTHTRLSRDSTMSPADLVARARAAGLDRVAVTDHNSMAGAFEAQALDPELIILGEEIDCEDGTDLIGLFLWEPIPAGLSVEETAARIRAQGGVVYAPHPFAYLTRPAERAEKVLAVADVVEAVNGRAFMPAWNRRALAAAESRGIPIAGGTDGHFAHEIGGTYTELPAFSSVESFRAALAHARPVQPHATSPLVHVRSIAVQLRKTIARAAEGRRTDAPAPAVATRHPATRTSPRPSSPQPATASPQP
jgi:predicted metal-dependent phosphoesterase TrpH